METEIVCLQEPLTNPVKTVKMLVIFFNDNIYTASARIKQLRCLLIIKTIIKIEKKSCCQQSKQQYDLNKLFLYIFFPLFPLELLSATSKAANGWYLVWQVASRIRLALTSKSLCCASMQLLLLLRLVATFACFILLFGYLVYIVFFFFISSQTVLSLGIALWPFSQKALCCQI